MAARLLPFAFEAPARNMAIDEALLRRCTRPVLRFYGWSPPAISLGHFQDASALAAQFPGATLTVVRRMTGGGAIVHWHELTYALILPASHPLIDGVAPRASYARIHEPIVEALATLGVRATSRLDEPAALTSRKDGDREPVLCFSRVTALDLIVSGLKLVGSAQRRIKDRVLQHGSIILDGNALQPGTAALNPLVGQPVAPRVLAEHIAKAFEGRLGGLDPSVLTGDELQFADANAARYLVR